MPHEAAVHSPRRTLRRCFVRLPDLGKQPPGFPELVVIKSGLKADESSQVSSL